MYTSYPNRFKTVLLSFCVKDFCFSQIYIAVTLLLYKPLVVIYFSLTINDKKQVGVNTLKVGA